MKLVKTEKVKRTVNVMMPQGNGTERREQFCAVFKMPSRTEFEDMIERMQPDEDGNAEMTVSQALREVLDDVPDVEVEGGEVLNQADRVNAIIDDMRCSQACWQEFLKLLNPEASKRKNSKRSRRD